MNIVGLPIYRCSRYRNSKHKERRFLLLGACVKGAKPLSVLGSALGSVSAGALLLMSVVTLILMASVRNRMIEYY